MPALKFLIVDDSPVVRLTLKQGLTQERVAPELIWDADTTRRAIELFDEVRPDVVFLDISLPEGGPSKAGSGDFLGFLTTAAAKPADGSDVVRHMLDRNPLVKFVVCTGNAPSDPRVRELVKAGAFQVLQKPIHLNKIREVVGQLRAELGAALE